jgi:hypothetical protein
VGGAGPRGLDVNSVKFSSDYFTYLRLPANGTDASSEKNHSHFLRPNVETNCENEPLAGSCGGKAWIAVVLQGL